MVALAGAAALLFATPADAVNGPAPSTASKTASTVTAPAGPRSAGTPFTGPTAPTTVTAPAKAAAPASGGQQAPAAARAAAAVPQGRVAESATIATETPESVKVAPRATATFNGTVYAIAYSADRIYVGGDFTAALWNGRNYPRKSLAALDARTGALVMDWAPAANGAVRGLAVSGDSLYVVGEFGSIDGVARDSIAAVNLTTGALGAIKHSISGTPLGVAAGNGRIYLVGRITSVDGKARGNVAAFSATTGELDEGWKARTDDTVEAVALGAGRVYLGGMFHKTNGVSSTGRLIAVRPDSGQLDPAFRPQPPAVVHAVAVGASGVYAAIGGQGGRLIAYSPKGAPQWTVTADGDLQAVAVLGDTVYFGGHFDRVCKSGRTGDHGKCLDGSVPRVKLGAANASTGALRGWDPEGNGIHGVFALVASPTLGILAAGGEFTTIGGASQRRFAAFNA